MLIPRRIRLILGAAVMASVTTARADIVAVYPNGDTVTTATVLPGWQYDDIGFRYTVTGDPLVVEWPEGLFHYGGVGGVSDHDEWRAARHTEGMTSGSLVIVDARTGDVAYTYAGSNGYTPHRIVNVRSDGGVLLELTKPNTTNIGGYEGDTLLSYRVFWPTSTWHWTTWERDYTNANAPGEYYRIDNDINPPAWNSANVSWNGVSYYLYRTTDISAWTPPRFVGRNLLSSGGVYEHFSKPNLAAIIAWKYQNTGDVLHGLVMSAEYVGGPSYLHANGSGIPCFGGGNPPTILDSTTRELPEWGWESTGNNNVMHCLISPKGPRPDETIGRKIFIPGDNEPDPVYPDLLRPWFRTDFLSHWHTLPAPDGHPGDPIAITPSITPAPRNGIIGWDRECNRLYVTGPMCMNEPGMYFIDGDPAEFVRVTERWIVWTWGVEPAPWWTPLIGDLNGDGCVDTADLGVLLKDWGEIRFTDGTNGELPTPIPRIGDLNGDFAVDGADLGILISEFGGCN